MGEYFKIMLVQLAHGRFQQRHGVIGAAGAKEFEVPRHRVVAGGIAALAHPAVEKARGGLRGCVLIDVIRRAEEVWYPRPGVPIPRLIVKAVGEQAFENGEVGLLKNFGGDGSVFLDVAVGAKLELGKHRLAVEAGVTLGWERFVGSSGHIVGLDRFGASAPASENFARFGFTKENVLQHALSLLA